MFYYARNLLSTCDNNQLRVEYNFDSSDICHLELIHTVRERERQWALCIASFAQCASDGFNGHIALLLSQWSTTHRFSCNVNSHCLQFLTCNPHASVSNDIADANELCEWALPSGLRVNLWPLINSTFYLFKLHTVGTELSFSKRIICKAAVVKFWLAAVMSWRSEFILHWLAFHVVDKLQLMDGIGACSCK